MNKYIIYIVLIFASFTSLNAQDAIYSQFYNANVLLNPSLTGVFDGQQRIAINYRDQWSSIHRSKSYKTLSAQFDAKIHIKNNDFLTYGIDFTRDESGTSSYLQQNGHINIGYIKQIGASAYSSTQHYLVGGLKLGGGQNSVDITQLWFGNQFDTNNGGVDWARPNNEDLINMNGNSPLFGDFGFGLLYYAIFSERNNVYLGASANHLNTPVISLSEFGDIRLKRLYTIHAGGEILLNRELSFMPNFVAYIQNPSRMVMPGFHMRYKHRDWKEVALRAGVWTRMVRGEPQAIINDAIIVSATFEYEAWLFGVSYDISTSRLINATSGRGAFEFSLQYINRDTKYRKPINCPKF